MVIAGHEGGSSERKEIRLTKPRPARSAQMEPEIKVGIKLPARTQWRSRADNPLPEAGHRPTDLTETIGNQLPVGGPLEHDERDNRRTQHRIVAE